MRREELAKKIADSIGVSGVGYEFIFKTFLDILTGELKDNEAIKFLDLGVFQLKKEPVPREERKMLPEGVFQKRVIVFSPISDSTQEKSGAAFLSFDVDDFEPSAEEYSEDVFELGINKPLIPLKKSGEEGSSIAIVSRLTEFIKNGMMIGDFNIWDDLVSPSHKESKEVVESSVIEEAEEKEEVAEEISDEDIFGKLAMEIAEDKTEADGELLDEIGEEINIGEEEEEFEPYTGSAFDESEAVFLPEQDEEENVGMDTLDDMFDEENLLEEFEEEDEVPIIEEEAEVEKKDLFDQLENYLDEDDNDIDVSEAGEEESVEDSAEETDEEETSEEVAEEENELTDSEEEDTISEEKWYKKKLVIISAASALGAIIIIAALFLFTGGDDETVKAKVDSANNNVPKKTEAVPAKSDSEKVVVFEEETRPPKPTGLYRESPSDKEITNRIFFDGNYYSVQMSSWRNSGIAEKEVARFKKRILTHIF